MRGRPILTLGLCGLLAGCGGFNTSSLNPFNWFGGGAEDPAVADSPDAIPGDFRPLIDQVTSIGLDRTPGGVILRATGLPPTLGYWEAGLVPDNTDELPDENGVLAFSFRALPPPVDLPAQRPQAREIVAGYYISNQKLRGVRTITVQGERNTLSVRP